MKNLNKLICEKTWDFMKTGNLKPRDSFEKLIIKTAGAEKPFNPENPFELIQKIIIMSMLVAANKHCDEEEFNEIKELYKTYKNKKS